MIYDETWTDNLLFGNEKPHVRLVTAATLGHPTRKPSITELVAATGLKRETVADAQRKIDPLLTSALEYRRALESGWAPTGRELFDLLTARPEAGSVIGLYDSPRRTRDSYPKRDGTNRLTVLRGDYDPDLADHPWKVPVKLTKKLPKGSRRNAERRLILAYYVRQQIIHGTILPDDLATAERLHLYRIDRETGCEEEPSLKTVESARAVFLGCGSLERHPSEPDLYVIPGLRVEEFYRASFKTARRIPLEGEYVDRLDLPATDAQAEKISRLIRVLGPAAAEEALWPDAIDEAEYDDGYEDRENGGAERAIAALVAALASRRGTQAILTGNPNDPDGEPKRNSRGTAGLTSTLDLEPFAPSGREGNAGEGEKALGSLPRVAAALASIYAQGTPCVILDGLRWTLERLTEMYGDGGPLTADQEVALDARIAGFLVDLERPTVGQVRYAVRDHPASDDALLGELKRLRPAAEFSDDIWRRLDGTLRDIPE